LIHCFLSTLYQNFTQQNEIAKSSSLRTGRPHGIEGLLLGAWEECQAYSYRSVSEMSFRISSFCKEEVLVLKRTCSVTVSFYFWTLSTYLVYLKSQQKSPPVGNLGGRWRKLFSGGVLRGGGQALRGGGFVLVGQRYILRWRHTIIQSMTHRLCSWNVKLFFPVVLSNCLY
jgi:hypothetical protein